MAEALIDRMRARRECRVEAGGHAFTVRRPTRLRMALWGGELRLAECVVGWDLTLSDLLPNEVAEPAPFDALAAAEWIEDRPEIFAAIVEELRRQIAAAQTEEEARAGKSAPTSS